MTIIKIKNDDISDINNSVPISLPKYTSQLMNLANQNAGGTRPRIVGQLSELFPEYLEESDCVPTIDTWNEWYNSKYPDAINIATEKVMSQINNLKNALPLIDEDMVKSWTTDLVINKTFNGLYIQKAILSSIAEYEKTTYRLATPEEESKGIDGYIGDHPVSIKPDTYEYMSRLNEQINVKMIIYSKNKDGITINY